MYFIASIFVSLQLNVYIMKVIHCHLQKMFLPKWQNKHQFACRVLKHFQGYLSTTLCVAFTFLQTCQTMPRLSYILITGNLLNTKNNTPNTF